MERIWERSAIWSGVCVSAIYMVCIILIVLQGTPPFMSYRALRTLIKNPTSKIAKHTAVDDMESFMWLLLSYLLQAGHASNSLSNEEMHAYKDLENNDVGQVAYAKLAMMDILKYYSADTDIDLLFLKPFIGILQPWMLAIAQAQKLVERQYLKMDRNPSLGPAVIAEVERICIKTLKDCIASGLAEVNNLQDTWDDYIVPKK